MMIRRAIPLALLSCFFVLSPVSGETHYEVQKLGDGVWAAQPDQGANVGWFLLGDSVVAVDSGGDEASAKTLLQKISETAGKPVRYLVVTHAHGDHAGGAGVFAAAGAQIICGETAASGIASVLQRSPATSRLPFLTVSERLAFIGGPRRAAIYWLGPAHTSNDLVVLLPDDKLLFSGDIVVNGRLPYMQSPDVDAKSWEKILPRLAAIDVDRVVPGHGTIGPKQGIADTLAYVHRVNELAAQFIQARVPEELFAARLRDPENRAGTLPVSEDHVANVRAVVEREKARLEKAASVPAPTPTRRPAKKR